MLIGDIRNLMLTMSEAESAERGFAITQKKEFLEPFKRARYRLFYVFETLKKDVADDPEHQARLSKVKELVDAEMKFLIKAIDLAKSGKQQEAVSLEERGEGERIMDEIRFQLSKMEEQEVLLLRRLVEKSQETSKLLNITIYVSLVLILALMGTAFYNMFTEIRRQARTEKELFALKEKAIEASEMKSHFLANMSHEIRTPLNGILGMIELMLHTQLTNEQRGFVDTLKESSSSLLALLNDILDLSKIESGRLEIESAPFEPMEVVTSVANVLEYPARHKKLKVTVFSDDTLPPIVLGDALRVRQVLLNLLGNAIKFSSQGTIQIRVGLVELKASRARLRFEVVDEGAGFDEATKRKLFKAFSQADSSTTRKYGGTGLGLAICRQLVELMEGKIDVISAPGKGSTFWFEIPFDVSFTRISKANEASLLHQPLMLEEQGFAILVVEDHVVNQKVVSSLLDKIGGRYKIANNGLEALEILSAEKFDLVLMDCHMPKMDGYEAARLIREGKNILQPQIPIIAATANVIKGEKEKCLEAGMNDYISKPMALRELQSKIYLWISKNGEMKRPGGGLLVNSEALKKIHRLDDQDGNLYQEIVDIFASTFPQDLKDMNEMLVHARYLDLGERAHRVKSTCDHLGITSMAEICFFIENNSFPENSVGLKNKLLDLENLYPQALAELKKISKAS